MSLCAFVLALALRRANGMRLIILLYVSCLVLPYYSHYLKNGRIFRKRLLNKKYVLIFSTIFFSEKFLFQEAFREIS